MELKCEVIESDGAFCRMYPCETGAQKPVIVIFSGSQGGIERADNTARLFAASGYPACAVAYFKFDALPRTLERIRIDGIVDLLEEIKKRKSPGNNNLILLGYSKGAELALLLGTIVRGLKAVVLYAPSCVVFEGIKYGISTRRSAKSSWLYLEKEIDFVHYSYDIISMLKYGLLKGLYRTSLEKAPNLDRARMKVENLTCPLCMISGTHDAIWPSADMSREIADALASSGFVHEVVNLVFDDTGHIPPGPAGFYPVKAKYIGGNDISNENARDESWKATLAFLKRNAE